MYNKIKEYCDLQHISISKMCSTLGISNQIITNLKSRSAENKNASLSAENTAKIADFMGISVADLIKQDKA